MSAEAPRYEGFAPGRHQIDAYGSGGFRFAGMSHIGSILATPRGVRAIDATILAEISSATLAPLFDEMREAQGTVEFLIVGTGDKMQRLPPPLAERLRGAGLRFDTMATGPASRVYNVMLSENRRVAALLLAAT